MATVSTATLLPRATTSPGSRPASTVAVEILTWTREASEVDVILPNMTSAPSRELFPYPPLARRFPKTFFAWMKSARGVTRSEVSA
ncbi:MAG: hypothetical protein IIC50_24295 [Planctomycetes bacterium]|nr:hypothetical protein [Planctomycetota bacterium]